MSNSRRGKAHLPLTNQPAIPCEMTTSFSQSHEARIRVPLDVLEIISDSVPYANFFDVEVLHFNFMSAWTSFFICRKSA
jgi:hypothetical protein